jgi:tRNA1Val (adenine37-N6)-methyltransferase
MPNTWFQFKQFTVVHRRNAMKVTTDSCVFGAWIAGKLKDDVQKKNVLDIGTGTGLLSIMIAQKTIHEFAGVEINADAAEEAGENVMNSPWKERINIIHSDVLQMKEGAFDHIISNPPFYENDLVSGRSSKDLAHHSSALKLAELLEFIKMNLKTNGCFFLMLPYRRKEEAMLLLFKNDFACYEILHLFHAPGHQSSRILLMGGRQKISTKENDLFIRNDNGNYSDDFIELLKDYYLYL